MANRGIDPGPALYLYGISRAPAPKSAKITSDSIDGIHPVQSLECGDFICWISAVDGQGFSREINRNMENLEWLALHSVRHQQVVAEIAATGTLIPTRFGAIFSSERALRENLQGRKSALQKVFARIAGADEWGVKIFAEQPPAKEVSPKARSGKEYLQEKAARLQHRPQRDDSGVKEFARELEKIAAGSASSGKISAVQPDLLWQATFLVPRSRRAQWDRTLGQFVKKWSGSRRIEINGPWPPYSFVSDAQ